MLRRQRQYYVGQRPRRGLRRSLIVGTLAGLGVAAGVSATMLPSLSVPNGSSRVAPTDTVPASPAAPASSAVPSGPGASTGPSPTTPAPTSAPGACPPSPANLKPARVVFHGSRTKKLVALTFDDGTNPVVTRRILATLKRERVNATFFPTGAAVELLPTVWKEVSRAGFPVGNHTFHHRALAGLCADVQAGELIAAHKAYMTVGARELPVMRPPYESFDAATRMAAAEASLGDVILWDVDTRDWEGRSAAQIVATALSGGKGSIVLLHTLPPATADALPAIIRGYRKRGFTFVTIGQLLGIQGPVPFVGPPK